MRRTCRTAWRSACQTDRRRRRNSAWSGPVKAPHGLGDVPAIQQPRAVGEMVLAQPFQTFVPVAHQEGEVRAEIAVRQVSESRTVEGQQGGGDQERFVGEAEAGGAVGLRPARARAVEWRPRWTGEWRTRPCRRRCWAFRQVESSSLMRAGTFMG